MSMTHDQMIEVIQAHKEGKLIQARPTRGPLGDGWDRAEAPIWDFDLFDYRVKPEPPKPRERWISFCDAAGCKEVVSDNKPIPECPLCQSFLVREVLEES